MFHKNMEDLIKKLLSETGYNYTLLILGYIDHGDQQPKSISMFKVVFDDLGIEATFNSLGGRPKYKPKDNEFMFSSAEKSIIDGLNRIGFYRPIK